MIKKFSFDFTNYVAYLSSFLKLNFTKPNYLSISFSVTIHFLLLIFFLNIKFENGTKIYSYTELSLVDNSIFNPKGTNADKEEVKSNQKKKEANQKSLKPVITSISANKPNDTSSNIASSITEEVGSPTGTGTGTEIKISLPPEKPKDEGVYLVAVDEMPEPLGGLQAIYSKLNFDKNNSIEGTVYVLAFIDETGIVRKAVLSKGFNSLLDKEAISAVKKTRFKAGRQKGINVKVQMHIPIKFE